MGKFSSVAGHGRVGVSVAGSVLLGHVQGGSDLDGIPVLEHGTREGVTTDPATTPVVSTGAGHVSGGQDPIEGKSAAAGLSNLCTGKSRSHC